MSPRVSSSNTVREKGGHPQDITPGLLLRVSGWHCNFMGTECQYGPQSSHQGGHCRQRTCLSPQSILLGVTLWPPSSSGRTSTVPARLHWLRGLRFPSWLAWGVLRSGWGWSAPWAGLSAHAGPCTERRCLHQMGHLATPSLPEMGTRARRQVIERKDEQPTLPIMLPTHSHLLWPPRAIHTVQAHRAQIWGSLHVPVHDFSWQMEL